jgi:hypothetical protein
LQYYRSYLYKKTPTFSSWGFIKKGGDILSHKLQYHLRNRT